MADIELTNQGEQNLTPELKDDKLDVLALTPELPEEPLLDVDADLHQALTSPEQESIIEREEIKMDNQNINEDFPDETPEPTPEQDIWVEEVNEEVGAPGDFVSPPEPALPPPPPPAPTAPPVQAGAPDSEERTWAMLAHLSILLNLVSGFLGPVAALIIYLVYKDKSRYVAYQSLQAFVFQLIWWVGAGAFIAIMWIFVGLLSAVVIGLCLIPFGILISLIPLVALVYGVVGGIKTNQGEDFRYWLIGDWLRSTLTGS